MSKLRERLFTTRPHLPYVLPIIVFGLFLAAESQWPQAKWFLYPLKTLATGACLWWVWGEFKSLSWRWSWLGVVIGIVVVVQWVGMEELFKKYWRYPAVPLVGSQVVWEENVDSDIPETEGQEETHSQANDEKTVLFNPEKEFGGRHVRFWIWVVIRMAGAVIVVPLMEELFWRGFLLRLLVGRYFERVELGEFTWFSCLAVAGLFALAHPWYISAFICALFYNWLLYKTKSILACVVAHALTNLLLWVYILRFDAWWLS